MSQPPLDDLPPPPSGSPARAGSAAIEALPPPPGVAGRPKATWSWWMGLLVYLGAMLLGGLAAIPFLSGLKGTVGEVLGTLVSNLVVLGVMILWLRTAHPGWKQIIGFPSRSQAPREIRWGALAGVVMYPVIVFGIGAGLSALFDALAGHQVNAPTQIDPNGLGAVGVVAAILLAVMSAPVTEEFVFRGVLFRSMRDRYGFRIGALGSAILFGLVHYVPAPSAIDSLLLMSVMVFTGIGLAWVYERRGNIVASMAAHAAFNIIGIALILGVR